MTGDIRVHENFSSRFLERSRRILVYLPPSYERARTWRYPVLYLHDGQNVFDPQTSFIPGEEWEVDESAESLIRSRSIRPLIIVAIYHAGELRMDEYTSTTDSHGRGGKADLYGRFLLEELMPFIESNYRTRQEARNVGIGGSSLGGLVTLYLGMRHPARFGKLAVMSPAVWWNNRAILQQIPDPFPTLRPRIWLDIGTGEGSRTVEDARMLRDCLTDRGWTKRDLHYSEVRGAQHSEAAWRARVPAMLRFLYPRYKII